MRNGLKRVLLAPLRAAWAVLEDTTLGKFFTELGSNLSAPESPSLLEARSLDDWEDTYWAVMRESVPLGNLERFLNAHGRMLLETEIVGRDRELDEFRAFLGGPDRGKVLYHFGEPGCGKSRLVIQYGRIAQEAGWSVFFMRQDRPVDLDRWLGGLRRETGAERVLVVWDDWQGADDDQLRLFLALDPATFLAKHGVDVCRVLTSWPEFRSGVRNLTKSSGGTPPLEVELRPLDSSQKGSRRVIDFVSDLFSDEQRPEQEQLEEVVRLCEGYPMALLLGLDLVSRGQSLEGLIGRESIIHRRYSELIQDIDDNPNLPDPKTLDAYRRLAMVGELRESDLVAEGIDELIPGFKERRRDLLKKGYVRFDDATKSYKVEPDLLRRWVAQCSLRGLGDDLLRLEQPVGEWVRMARPFLPRWTAEIWAITTLALEADEELLEAVSEDLFRAIDEVIEERGPFEPPTRRRALATALATAGLARPGTEIFLRFAEQIAKLGSGGDSTVGLWQARTLYNATVTEEGETECRQIAEQIQIIAERHQPPHPDIDFMWAEALYNATVPAETLDERRQIAKQIQTIAKRHDPPHPDIDLAWAKALYNATVATETATECRQITHEIQTVAERHQSPQPDIDLQWAKALRNTAIRDPDPDRPTSLTRDIQLAGAPHPQFRVEFVRLELQITLFRWRFLERDMIRKPLVERRIAALVKTLENYPGILIEETQKWIGANGSHQPLPPPPDC